MTSAQIRQRRLPPSTHFFTPDGGEIGERKGASWFLQEKGGGYHVPFVPPTTLLWQRKNCPPPPFFSPSEPVSPLSLIPPSFLLDILKPPLPSTPNLPNVERGKKTLFIFALGRTRTNFVQRPAALTRLLIFFLNSFYIPKEYTYEGRKITDK